METLTQNKSIATFMELEESETGDFSGSSHMAWFKNGIKIYDNAYIPYHTSWNWLMPVVEKIKSIETAKRIGIIEFGDWNEVLNKALITVNIKTIYTAVVEFITWLNKHKK